MNFNFLKTCVQSLLFPPTAFVQVKLDFSFVRGAAGCIQNRVVCQTLSPTPKKGKGRQRETNSNFCKTVCCEVYGKTRHQVHVQWNCQYTWTTNLQITIRVDYEKE